MDELPEGKAFIILFLIAIIGGLTLITIAVIKIQPVMPEITAKSILIALIILTCMSGYAFFELLKEGRERAKTINKMKGYIKKRKHAHDRLY